MKTLSGADIPALQGQSPLQTRPAWFKAVHGRCLPFSGGRCFSRSGSTAYRLGRCDMRCALGLSCAIRNRGGTSGARIEYQTKKCLATTYSPTPWGAVPSAREGLTSVVGMGTGVSPPLWSPGNSFACHLRASRTTGAGPAGTSLCARRRRRPPRSAIRYVCACCSRRALQLERVSHEPRRARRVSEKYGQAARAISTGRLNMLPCVDRQPINQLFSLGPLGASRARGWFILRKASHLDAFSGYPVRTWLLSTCRWRDNWYTRGSSTPVLSY